MGAEAYSAEGGSGILWGRGLGVGSFQGYAIQQGARYRLGKVVEGVEVKHERVSPYYRGAFYFSGPAEDRGFGAVSGVAGLARPSGRLLSAR